MSGIGVEAAIFLFREGCQEKRGSGAVARLLGVAGKTRKLLGVPRKTGSIRSGINEPWESRLCCGTVGGPAEAGNGNHDSETV